MPRASQLTLAKRDILSHFEASRQKVYSDSELAGVLLEHRPTWNLAQHTTTKDFIAFLGKEGKLRARVFRSHAYNRKVTRYAWGDPSIYSLALSLKSRGYLSHASAVALHGLTDLIPRTVYLNVEQSPKPRPAGPLTQDAIDKAFSRKQRQSNLSYRLDNWTTTLVNGKNTGGLGVEELTGPSSELLRVTNLERTLIDIAVRPAYAGGIFQVLEAYRAAKSQISLNRLVATLKKLDYVYPYHQAIGFLMQQAGYEPRRLSLLKELGIRHKFYLVHGVESPDYNETWQLFHPKGFEARGKVSHKPEVEVEGLKAS